jgi:hypothetical protein
MAVLISVHTPRGAGLRHITARFPPIAATRCGRHLSIMFLRGQILDPVVLSVIVAEIAVAAVKLVGG